MPYSGKIHFHIGRAFGGDKAYRVWPATYKYAMGFPFQIRNQDSNTGDGGTDMLYGSDTLVGNRGDQLVAFTMINNGEVASGIRNMPVHSIWAAAKDEFGLSTPFLDGNHYAVDTNESVVSYMMTLLTGRCPIGKNGTETERARRRIGYETSWVMSTLNLRAPGFSVHPSAHDAKTVTPGTEETMSVYFVNAPQSEVTVNVSASVAGAAIVNPKVLSFDGSNHDVIQNVRVVGLPGASANEDFNVVFDTGSSDMCYANLSDSWKYTLTRTSTQSFGMSTQADRQVSAPKNGSQVIDLQVVGALKSNTVLAHPIHGTLSWNGSNLVYAPDADYVGADSFAFAVNDGVALTKGYIEISVEDLPSVVLTESAGTTEVTEGGATDSYTLELNEAPLENVTVSITGDAQVSVSPNSVTFSPGDWMNPREITLTAVDDGDDELLHSGFVSHAVASDDANWDGVFIPALEVTITDNDNLAPVVDAGPDQVVYMDGGQPWSPAEISTVAWFDANDASSIIQSGGKVSQWNDKSGNGNHATQTTGASQPNYTSSDAILGKR